ncbi:hypothetical protein OIU78_020386 [Salix suchowensis]|nr:hypothetical protein OIU78_020386 [Salix suchowensis]
MGMQRYEMDAVPFRVQNVIVNFSREPDRQAVKKVVTEVELRALEDILARVASQTTKEEQEYIAEENIQNQVQKDRIDLQRKFSLMEAIVKETKALQDLTRYPYKHYNTSELEQHYASLAEQLPKRCVCPLCYADNVEVLGGVLQSNEPELTIFPEGIGRKVPVGKTLENRKVASLLFHATGFCHTCRQFEDPYWPCDV